jgi:sulfur carrier protein
MTIELNGETIELVDEATVATAIAETGAVPGGNGIAVAVDGEVVPKSKWGLTPLRNGQRVEVVGAIQGG